MNKLCYYLLTEFRLFKHSFWQSLISILLIPLIMSGFFAFSFSSSYQPEFKPDPIKLSLDNQDRGSYGQELVNLIEDQQNQSLFEIKNAEEADFNLLIKENYSNQLSQTAVEIKGKTNVSHQQGQFLQHFISQWQTQLAKNHELIQQSGEQYPTIMETLQMKTQDLNHELFEQKTFSTDKTLSSTQYSSIASMHYLIFILTMSAATLNSKKEFSGLRKRISTVPLSAAQSVSFDLISHTLLTTFYTSLYILIWKLISPESFAHNPLFYLFWMGLFSFLMFSFYHLINYLIPTKYVMIVLNLLMYLYMFLIIFPMDDILSGPIAQWIASNPMRELFQQPLIHYLKTGQWTTHWPIALWLIIVSIVMALITIYLKQLKEER